MIRISQRMADDCCGTTCSKHDLLRAIEALEASCDELSFASEEPVFEAGAFVLDPNGSKCQTLHPGLSRVACVYHNGAIKVWSKTELTPTRRGVLP